MIKNLLNIIIAFLFLCGAFHYEGADHSISNEYSFCSEGCDNNHLSIQHHCEKCLNKNNRLIFNSSFNHRTKKHCPLFYSFEEIFDNNYLLTNLSSRPPPDIL